MTADQRSSILNRARQSFYTMLWLMLVTFPLIVMKNDEISNSMGFRWAALAGVGIGGFVFAYTWDFFMKRRNRQGRKAPGTAVAGDAASVPGLRAKLADLASQQRYRNPALVLVAILVLAYPFVVPLFHTGIMTTALIYVVLGLGLNIIIGWGGLLNLGYAAFFSIGAYTYALLYKYLGVGFWVALPLGGIVAALFGVIVGLPVLRLRGDYLAIVTLAFGEIVRILLQNLGDFTGGPDGISQIPRPDFFGLDMSLQGAFIFTYFVALAAVLFTVFIMRRVENSRWGRAWEAMREDEVAAQAMGVNITRAKLTTFALGSFFAGISGVIMAAKTTKVTPDSFDLEESIIVLSIVVLGGMGSIPGVIVGALILKLLPEYFRAFSSYRMLVFGLVLVVMMVFKPEGIISKIRKTMTLDPAVTPSPEQDAPDKAPETEKEDGNG